MRQCFAVLFVAAILTSPLFAFDCTVSCPTGYLGACLRSGDGCACTCQKAKQLQEGIADLFKNAGASEKFIKNNLSEFAKYSGGTSHQVPFSDKWSGKEFTLIIQEVKGH